MSEDLHHFSHDAMNSSFEVLVSGHEKEYARQASESVFLEIDRLEGVLSRFELESDIGQINLLKPGEQVRVGIETMECLLTSLWVHSSVNGAFDITLGPILECFRDKDGQVLVPSEDSLNTAAKRVGMDRLELDSDNLVVKLKDDGCSQGVVLDLGGVGKGFAVDKASEIFADWGIENVLIDAGGSTVLALGVPEAEASGWKVGVGGSWGEEEGIDHLVISDRALSGSGTEIQGEHIVNPVTLRPGSLQLAAWTVCPSAAVADALSTAFMLMTPDEIEKFIEKNNEIEAFIVGLDEKMLSF